MSPTFEDYGLTVADVQSIMSISLHPIILLAFCHGVYTCVFFVALYYILAARLHLATSCLLGRTSGDGEFIVLASSEDYRHNQHLGFKAVVLLQLKDRRSSNSRFTRFRHRDLTPHNLKVGKGEAQAAS
ncbi:hypothetical protein BDZ89DRAFT_1032885 [Hymenopellis radicata]|nr:hypothetical protein BDZ89DRAFT_1032885 [Hymenopellis radicata]